MHPLTAISMAIAASPHLWKVVHAAPASAKTIPFPSVQDMESCQNKCLGKYPANDLDAQFDCNLECLHFPVSLLPPSSQSRLINRGVTTNSPLEKFDNPVCIRTCEHSDHGKADCTDVCQRLLPCWMYCTHEYEHDSAKTQHCLQTCVADLKNATSSSARFDATTKTADLRPAFPDTLLAVRDTAKACAEDIDRDVTCVDQPKMMVPRNDHDRCKMNCDEIQHAHGTYLCRMNCTGNFSIDDIPPSVHARDTADTLGPSTVRRSTDAKTTESGAPTGQDDENDCPDYCNAHTSGGSADEIRDRCSKACKTLEVCETACEAQGPNDGERCVVDCLMIGSDAKEGSAVVARDSIAQIQASGNAPAAVMTRDTIPHVQAEAGETTLAIEHFRGIARLAPFADFDDCLKECRTTPIRDSMCNPLCHNIVDCNEACKEEPEPGECYDECGDQTFEDPDGSMTTTTEVTAPSVIPRAQAEPKKMIPATNPPTNQPSVDDCTEVCLSNLDAGTTEELRPKCRAACQVTEDCGQACKEVHDSTKHLDCVGTCLGRSPPPTDGMMKKAIAAASRAIVPQAQFESDQSNVTVGPLDKRYPPDQCKWACHEIDDPTNQICYQPCIDAGPGQKDGSIMTAADFVSLNIIPHLGSEKTVVGTQHLDKRYPPDQCKWACHEIDDPTNQICYQPCIDAGPGQKDGSIMTAADFVSLKIVPHLESQKTVVGAHQLDKRYPPDQCKWACHEIDDPTNQICYQPCIDAGPHGSINAAADFVSLNILPHVQAEAAVRVAPLDKRYPPDQCKWACHEIDDPTNQICYQPCIDAGPHGQDTFEEVAAVVRRSKVDDMPNQQGINISSPLTTTEDLDRCTHGCIAYAEADSYPEPGKPCSQVCLGIQACQSMCASIEDHETNVMCGIECFMATCQAESIDCSCMTSKPDGSNSSTAECRISPPAVMKVRAVRDVAGSDGFDQIEGASKLREMSLARRDDQDYDGPSTTISSGDFPTSTTMTGFVDIPTVTESDLVPSVTMIITEAAGSTLGCKGWQVVWVVVVAGVTGGVFLW